jgi:hypothetical protein
LETSEGFPPTVSLEEKCVSQPSIVYEGSQPSTGNGKDYLAAQPRFWLAGAA